MTPVLLATPFVAVLLGVAWQPVLIASAGTAGTVAVAVLSWMAARRVTSGQVATSDAATLWKASEQIRLELRDEVKSLRERVAVLEADQESYRSCKDRVAHLEAEVERLRRGLHNV